MIRELELHGSNGTTLRSTVDGNDPDHITATVAIERVTSDNVLRQVAMPMDREALVQLVSLAERTLAHFDRLEQGRGEELGRAA